MKHSLQKQMLVGGGRIVRMGLIVGVFLAVPCFCEAGDVKAADIQALQKERISTLEKLLKLSQTRYAQGQGNLSTVMEAMIELGEARLEVERTLDGRSKVMKNMVGVWKQYEELLQERIESGVAPMEDLLRVRAGRLKAELQLARHMEAERAKAAKDQNAGKPE